MNNDELDKMIKSAPIPDARGDFWAELPTNVQRGLNRVSGSTARAGSEFGGPRFFWKWAAPLAFAAVCVAVGFFWGARARKVERVGTSELAEARACWREASALFPNQLEAIVFGQRGPQMMLSDKPDQPVSAPIFLKVCDGKTCRRIVTFSGQQIEVNGESFEVLIDLKGEVILVGDAKVWKSSGDSSDLGPLKVFARLLANS
jgi:hypothetical protein